MPIIGQKNANSDKTNVYYGTKELLECPILTIFTKKSLLSHKFVKKLYIL